MHQAAVVWVGTIDQGDSANRVLFVVDFNAQDGVVRAVLVYLPRTKAL